MGFSMDLDIDQAAGMRAAGGRGRNLTVLLLCCALAGCSSSAGNPGQLTANAPGPGLPPSSQANYPAPGQTAAPVAAAPPISDGVHPNQSITDLFRDSTVPQSSNVPHPPSSYTPAGQPYSPPGQPIAGGPQAVAATPPPQPPPISDGVHPNQSISDIFR